MGNASVEIRKDYSKDFSMSINCNMSCTTELFVYAWISWEYALLVTVEQGILSAVCWWPYAPGGLGLGRSCAESLGCKAPGPGDRAVSCVFHRTRNRILEPVTGTTTYLTAPASTVPSVTNTPESVPTHLIAVRAFPSAAPFRGIGGDMNPSLAGSWWPWSGRTCGLCPWSSARSPICWSGPRCSMPWSRITKWGRKSIWKLKRSVSKESTTLVKTTIEDWRLLLWRPSPTEPGFSGNLPAPFTLQSLS